MPLPLQDFNKAYALAQGKLPERILAFLEGEKHAHSAREIAEAMMGIQGAHTLLLAPEVAEVLPTIETILAGLVAEGKIRRMVVQESVVRSETFFAKREG